MLLRHELQVADVADEPVLAHLPVVDAALESLVAALRVRHHGLSRDTVARQACASQQRRAQILEGLARALQGLLVDYQRGVDEELASGGTTGIATYRRDRTESVPFRPTLGARRNGTPRPELGRSRKLTHLCS